MTPGFVNYWEHEITKPKGPQYSFAREMVELPKVVFSRTLNSLDGRNVRVENGDLKAAVNQLKRGLGRDIVVYGGATPQVAGTPYAVVFLDHPGKIGQVVPSRGLM